MKKIEKSWAKLKKTKHDWSKEEKRVWKNADVYIEFKQQNNKNKDEKLKVKKIEKSWTKLKKTGHDWLKE